MIIVSQDKRDILNFDFTQRIGLDRETDFTSIIAYQNGNAEAECLWLGSYKTEERAKEVLKEIWNFYEIAKRHESSGNDGITIYLENRFTYQMPEN